MPEPTSPPTYTARSPEDLLALVPYLLGFHPEESVVVLTFGAPEGCFHARVDLPDSLDDQREVARLLDGAVARHRVPRVAVLVYSTDARAAASQTALLLERWCAREVEVVAALRADGERWFLLPESEIAGAGTPYDLASHPFTAERVYHGQVVHRSRAELARSLVGPPDEATAVAAAEHGERIGTAARDAPDGGAALLRTEARWVQRRIRLHLRDRRLLPPSDAGRLLSLASLVPVRDVAWSEMTRSTAPTHVGLWRDLVRRCPDELLPGPGSLLAFAAWLAGDGALAWCAVDRVTAVDAGYSMARRVAECLTSALPPSVWSPVPEGELPVFADEP
ncbi:MAG TPA: DUF4192 domain-containing protein [Marmoricola sp.]